MTIYRVGDEGATVFSPEGRAVVRLRPGQVVVPGTADADGSLAQQYAEQEKKRLRGYADKQLRSPEDKATLSCTPPRQPDPRLQNPLAGSG